jgi:acyl dehydratase
MPLNFDLAGKTYDSVEKTITAEQIEAYAAASRDDNPRHRADHDDQVASPIFPVVPGFAEMGRVTTDPELNVENPLMIVHGEEEIVYHRPMKPGMTLTLTPSLESVEDKGKGATYVAKITAEAGGELVNEQYATIFVRGAGSGEERPKAQRPAPPTRGDEIASFIKHVDEGMPPEYAEASGDHNPIHLDPSVATAVGLPGVINHGLGTLSLVSGGLVEHLAAGDPTRLRRLEVRFTDMVIPGSDLGTMVWESDGDSFLFETTRPDGAVVMTGSLEVAAD